MKNSVGRDPARGASRRRFLKLVALGPAAAAAAGVIPAASATRGARRKPAATGRGETPAMRREIENQKQSAARSLETLRRHPLPAGSAPASVFVPLEVARGPGKDTGGGRTR